MFFDVALRIFAMLQFLYFDVALANGLRWGRETEDRGAMGNGIQWGNGARWRTGCRGGTGCSGGTGKGASWGTGIRVSWGNRVKSAGGK